VSNVVLTIVQGLVDDEMLFLPRILLRSCVDTLNPKIFLARFSDQIFTYLDTNKNLSRCSPPKAPFLIDFILLWLNKSVFNCRNFLNPPRGIVWIWL